MAQQFSPVILGNFQTDRLLPLSTYAPDTYVVPVQPSGNSMLSSLLVLDLDVGATVTVSYFQTTSGNEFEERTPIGGHEAVTVADDAANQTLVTRIHNKVFAEVVVTGGAARLGLIATVVSSFATDLETALKRDGQDANLALDRGFPMAVFDETAGEFRFLRSQGGALVLTSTPGAGAVLAAESVTTPGAAQTLISSTSPTLRKLTGVDVVCRQEGSWRLTVAGSLVAAGRTGPLGSAPFRCPLSIDVNAGEVLQLSFESRAGSPSVSVEAFIHRIA